MSTLGLAFRLFFRTFKDAEFRTRAERLLRGEVIEEKAPLAEVPTVVDRGPPKRTAPKRSEALTLLEALQREARLVDFLQEPISGYSDAQIGAAVRDIHRDCAQTLERLFAVRPLLSEQEGAAVEVPVGFDAARYRLTGSVSGQPPYRGTLAHQGWQATRCELPEWNGSEQAAYIIAPTEVELA